MPIKFVTWENAYKIKFTEWEQNSDWITENDVLVFLNNLKPFRISSTLVDISTWISLHCTKRTKNIATYSFDYEISCAPCFAVLGSYQFWHTSRNRASCNCKYVIESSYNNRFQGNRPIMALPRSKPDRYHHFLVLGLILSSLTGLCQAIVYPTTRLNDPTRADLWNFSGLKEMTNTNSQY